MFHEVDVQVGVELNTVSKCETSATRFIMDGKSESNWNRNILCGVEYTEYDNLSVDKSVQDEKADEGDDCMDDEVEVDEIILHIDGERLPRF